MSKIINKMTVTEEQLKVVFEMGAASEEKNLVEVTFTQEGDNLFVHEWLTKPDSGFLLKTTLISRFGVRTTDIEISPEQRRDIDPW